jgi:hypothetical protein
VVVVVEERPASPTSRSWDRLDEVLRCVRLHESAQAGGYRAVYPDASVSSASGAYQMTDPTWRNLLRELGIHGPARAFLAPASLQDRVARHALESGYGWAWDGTGCPGTDR